MQRKELEHSVSGLMTEQYPAEYVKHHVDRLHIPGALRLLDLELSGPIELVPGVRLEHAGGHTEGSMNILVETAAGVVCICGDVIYDVQDQIVAPLYQMGDYDPQVTGNHSMRKREEKARGLVKALNSGSFVVPSHDWPARTVRGQITARLGDAIPRAGGTGRDEAAERKRRGDDGRRRRRGARPHQVAGLIRIVAGRSS